MKEEIENRKDEKRMNKNVIGLIIAVIVIIIAVAGFMVYKNSNINNDNIEENVTNNGHDDIQPEENKGSEANTEVANTENTTTSNTETENTANGENKILIVYYSAQSHTKSVAEKIAKNLNADLFEIIPEDVYTEDDLNWLNSNSRVSREHNDESLRDVKLKNTKVDNWEKYDTVLIGYPIWWGIAAWPVDNFVKENNFTGKTVIPFCTSASSGLGNSGKLLEKEANSGNWQEGHRFSSSATDADIKLFTDSIK